MKICSYILTPFLAWFIAGMLKFFINSFRAHRFAFDLIGYGGLPSNHSAIVSSMVMLIGLNEGLESAIFGLAVSFAFIVILDAGGLRRHVGRHAAVLNRINNSTNGDSLFLRERIGHTVFEICSGILVGFAVGYLVWFFC